MAKSTPEKTAPNAGSDDSFSHLLDSEADILRQQVSAPATDVGITTLYRYATISDKIILVISAICAVAGGAALPLMTLLFGNLQGTFQEYLLNTILYEEYNSRMTSFVLYFVYLAIGQLVVFYISVVGFLYTGEHISNAIRERYLSSCLRQNIGYFDSKMGNGEITSCITTDIDTIRQGISEKLGFALTAVATFFSAFIIGFVSYWKLTLVLFSTVVALLTIMSSASVFITRYSIQMSQSTSLANSIIGDVLQSIRTTVAFGAQDRLAKKHEDYLSRAERDGFRMKATVAVMVAGMMLVLYLNYALSFWVGSTFLIDEEVSLQKVLTIMMAIMLGAFELGHVSPHVQAFLMALSSAQKLFNTIDRLPPLGLDPTLDTGDEPDKIVGTIRFDNVKHIYPSRPQVAVLDSFSLVIPAGKTTAIVGPSGSGKSTIASLLERFYAPVSGNIYLDGRDISLLNLRWLRRTVSLVSQEPRLFDTTIYENIRHGLLGSPLAMDSLERQNELIVAAAKKANAHEFITELSQGYDTVVGERGFLLSGGQKQRIAIARAIVSDPKVLILDEATSALDSESESSVQTALTAASYGRTTITIAHRLSTIQDAHNIVVLSKGFIIEQGTHIELLQKEQAYFRLVESQRLHAEASLPPQTRYELLPATMDQTPSLPASQGGQMGGPNVTSTDKAAVAAPAGIVLQRSNTRRSRNGWWATVKFIASLNMEEGKLMVWGCFWSIICGAGNPVQAVFFGKQIATLSAPLSADNISQVKHASNFWSAMYVMLAVVQFIAFLAQGVAFAHCSERLIHRVRDRAFRAVLRQDISFFDETSTGTLEAFMSTEVKQVTGLSAATLSTLIIACSTLVGAMSVSLAIGWKLSLVCIATIPLLLACGFTRFYMLAYFQAHARNAFRESAGRASEAISSIRTVAALTREDQVSTKFHQELEVQQRDSLYSVLKSSIFYAASQSLVHLVFALGFWYGGTLIARHEYDLFQFFVCFSAIVFGAQSAGTFFSYSQEIGNAHQAAVNVQALFEREVAIDTWVTTGRRIHPDECKAAIEFRNVDFSYPTRPNQQILRGFSLKIDPGQHVALVGPSGCGKSTVVALLDRFYDPVCGNISLNGQDIRSLNLNDYRAAISIVSQEPNIFYGTIRENVLLGAPATREISEEAIVAACRDANIFDFIASLPDGMDTVVGGSGVLLSGGQKQRIALARALVRDPKILLLDEATSSLDSESELLVQASLDQAAFGRTTISVAHRLSTIQRADVILFMHQGAVAEIGTHEELVNMDNRYARFVKLQSLEGSW
ncbi:uncharacterized protein JN550_010091 [Neoarthrinium moseri]|uniref:uncharacterized protein n=1 Tax=Neoarthrinium moseri TaxID=1658444 RepID=UPI001FDD440B|nr:uncharacterized protein JN550_010091 [Neoarthrinium moseri]KAI1862754.1 hypothetical protein JN550_010091 [Neoarthrinium moseri]